MDDISNITYVGNFPVRYKDIVVELADRLSDRESDDGVTFTVSDKALDIDYNPITGYVSLHVYNNVEGDIRRFYDLYREKRQWYDSRSD